MVLLLATCTEPKEISSTTFTIDTLINGFQLEALYSDLIVSRNEPLTYLPSYHSVEFLSPSIQVGLLGIDTCVFEHFSTKLGTLLLIDSLDTLSFTLRLRPEGQDSLYIRGALAAGKYHIIRKEYTPEEMLDYLSGTEKKLVDCKGIEHPVKVKTVAMYMAFLDSGFYFEKTHGRKMQQKWL